MQVMAIRLKNFTTFQDSGWLSLKPITFLLGRNSSGKSNFRRALEYLGTNLKLNEISSQNGVQPRFFTLNNAPMFKSYGTLKKDDVEFCFRIDPQLKSNLLGYGLSSSINVIEVNFKFKQTKNKNVCELSEIYVFSLEAIAEGPESPKRLIIKAVPDHNRLQQRNWKLQSDWYKVTQVDNPIWRKIDLDRNFPPQVISSENDLDQLVKIKVSIDDNGNINYGPYGEILYEGDDEKEEVRTTKTEVVFLRNLLSLIRIEILNFLDRFKIINSLQVSEHIIEAQEELQAWLHKIFDDNNVEIHESLIGSGAFQFSRTLRKLLELEKDQTCYLEHPDMFLHPYSQANLADLFIYLALKKEINLIIETHSELMLLRLLRRVRETFHKRLPKDYPNTEDFTDKISISIITKDAEQRSRATLVELSEDGEIVDWPSGFFEEGYMERFSEGLL